MSFFITFEGVEGCGKSTQINILSERLKKNGYRTLLTREPGGCPIADKIRSILLDANNNGMAALTELLLYSASRAQHVAEVILPALESDVIVLCDRFIDATIAYQHFGRGIDRSTIDTLNILASQTVAPDLTVLMDFDVSIGLARAKSRIEASSGPREERFELETLAFHQRVRNGYKQLAAENIDRFLTINAIGSVDEISNNIAEQVLKRIKDSSRAIC